MSELIGLSTNWKNVKTLAEATQLVDYGVIMPWRDAKRLIRALTPDECEQFVAHLATRLAEQNETRLVDEMLMETSLNWLTNATNEKPLQVFLETFLTQPDRSESAFKLVEVALTAEMADPEHDEDLFATAVSLVCELGLAINEIDRNYPGEIQRARSILDHVATYLLSVSNTNNNRIRLSLLNYFGASEAGRADKIGFNKVLGRFGHTVLDHLFYLLFKKKTEAVALQYLMENLPYILEADRHAQTIVHETWKFYMLKKPERFGLFLKTFSEQYKTMNPGETEISRRVYFQHLGALMRVVSEVNHRQLTQVLLQCFGMFQGVKERDEVLDALIQLPDMRKNIRELLSDLRKAQDPTKVIESASRFIDSKRGRKPSFSRVEGWVTLNQVNYLGIQPIAAKVS